MDIQFVAGVAVVAADPPRSRELIVDALGLPLEAGEGGDYFHSERIDGTKHFGVWPLAQAAQACFGEAEWLLHDAREEPWGQTVARLLSIEGLIIGISYAPSLHPAG